MPNKKKRTTRKKPVTKSKAKRKPIRIRTASKSVAPKKKFSPKSKRVTSTGVVVGAVEVPSGERRGLPAGHSGDLQNLSNPPTANSESVEELLEERNALEAKAVQGVENALDADQGEVKTREVPEDGLPQEYLDHDR